MQKLTWRWIMVMGALLPLLTTSGRADDSFPPCWRGGVGATYQDWSFAVSNNPAPPDAAINPNGTAQAVFTIGAFGKGWLATTLGGRTGAWELGKAGSVNLSIPNYTAQAPWKYVYLQVTYFKDGFAYLPPTVSIPTATLVSSQVQSNQVAGPGRWETFQSVWFLQPSPSTETVQILGSLTKGLLIDEIIVDTLCPLGGDGDVPAYMPCWRGEADSTFQHWTFGASNGLSGIVPEIATNSYGPTTATVAPGLLSVGWIESDPFLGCRQGIWDLGGAGAMTLAVPNVPSAPASSVKYVRVQVTQYRDGIYTGNAAVTVAGATQLGSALEQTIETTDFGGTWVVEQTVWQLAPCPSGESIMITAPAASSLIDQVVVDTLCTEPPACPADLSLAADSGQCSAAGVTWPTPTVDGCLIQGISYSPSSGSTFPIGVTPVTQTVTDAEGQSQICTFTVTVSDSQAPVVQCPADLVLFKASNDTNCGAVATFTPNATDNCLVTNIQSTPASGSLFPLGITTVTCIAQDASGNSSAPCTFTVQVLDLTADLPAFQPCWRGEADSTFQHWTFGASNGLSGIVPEIATNSYGPTTATVAPGLLSVGWIESDPFLGCRQGIWDLGGAGAMTLAVPNVPSAPASSVKYVRVQVTQYRDGIYTGNAAVTVAGATQLGSALEQTIETTDFGGTWVVEQTVWQLAPCPSGESIMITAPAASSLIDQVVVDTLCTEPPACPADLSLAADSGQCSAAGVTWPTPTVDGCLIQGISYSPSSGSTFPIGVTPVTQTVTDAEGQSQICTFTVTVSDSQAPVPVCQDITIPLGGTGSASITASQVDGGSADNCGIASITVTPDTFTCADIGPNNVTLAVTDVNGLISTCTAVVTVVDQTPPLPDLVSLPDVTGECSADVTGVPTATDNCIGVVAGTTTDPLTYSAQGTYTVTWTYDDGNGNTVQQTQTVIVDDVTAPVADVATLADVTDECSATPVAPIATDACAGVITGSPDVTFPIVAQGTTVVTWTYDDGNGNTSTQTQNVIVTVEADLSVVMLASPDPVTVGGNLNYTLTVSNAGPCTATDVVVSNFFSPGQVGFTVTNGMDPGMACLTPGPVAWWRAEGDATDAANANDGTAAGGSSYVPGIVGQAFSFDGTTASVSVPDSLDLTPQSLTIEGWVKIDDVTGVHVIIGKRLGIATLGSYSLWVESGVLYAGISDGAGAGPSLSYPEFPSSSGFYDSDLVDLQSFANKIKTPTDAVSTFISTNISVSTMVLLAAYSGGPDATLHSQLITDLNVLISSGSIYDPVRFAAVSLSAESQYILGRNPMGSDLVRLNRYLIRDAYPAEFASTVFPQLTQWFHVVYTFDDSTKVQALYVNGVLVNAGFVNKSVFYDTHPVLIGADDDGGVPGYFFQGEIDELAFYGRAITGTEIQAIYQTGAAGKCAIPGIVSIGSLAVGATAEFTLVSVPTNCPLVSATATVVAATTDPETANDFAAASASVQDLPANQWGLTIDRVSDNNDLLRITWPIVCGAGTLEAAGSLNAPISWNPIVVPVELIDNRQSTIVSASEEMQYFRMVSP